MLYIHSQTGKKLIAKNKLTFHVLLVKDRQILGISACVLIWIFPCYMEYYQVLDHRWENCPSDTKLHIGYRNRNYDKLTEKMEEKDR